MLSHVLSVDEAAVVETVIGGGCGVAMVLGAYLVASTAASLLVHGLHYGRRVGALVRVVDAVTLPPLRRLVRAVVGVSVAAGTYVGSASGSAAAGASTDPPAPVMRRLGDEAPVVMQAATTVPATQEAPPVEEAPPAPAPEAAATEWTVRPGDHFWRVAEEALAAQLHRVPTDGETDPYWRRLVTANRDRLADRDNPDLLFPGQVLLLPAPTGA